MDVATAIFIALVIGTGFALGFWAGWGEANTALARLEASKSRETERVRDYWRDQLAQAQDEIKGLREAKPWLTTGHRPPVDLRIINGRNHAVGE